MKQALIILGILIVSFGCVDRVFFDITQPPVISVSISGYISTDPGPYQVSVIRTFDTQSYDTQREGFNVKSLTMYCSDGTTEDLKRTLVEGVYETMKGGIRGKVGNAYWLKAELYDGRVYQSKPDTMAPGATLDSVYNQLTIRKSVDGTDQSTIDVYANTTFNAEKNHGRYIWVMTNTFKSKTKPDLETGSCYWLEDKCNFRNPCTGLRNTIYGPFPNFVRVHDCQCCVCWYQAYNDHVVINERFLAGGHSLSDQLIQRIPLNAWMLMYKMHLKVEVRSLSAQAYAFWRSIKNQQTASNSIFQPITGKIAGNFEQLAGNEVPAQGMFYASSINSKGKYFLRSNIPIELIPAIPPTGSGEFSCFELFPNAKNTPPDWWVE